MRALARLRALSALAAELLMERCRARPGILGAVAGRPSSRIWASVDHPLRLFRRRRSDRHGFRRRLRRSCSTAGCAARRRSVENGAYVGLLAAKAQRCAQFYVRSMRPLRSAASICAQAAQKRRLRIGWTGSPATYAFIAPLLPSSTSWPVNYPIELVLMGVKSVDYRFTSPSLVTMDWSEGRGIRSCPDIHLDVQARRQRGVAVAGGGQAVHLHGGRLPFVASDVGIAKAAWTNQGLDSG